MSPNGSDNLRGGSLEKVYLKHLPGPLQIRIGRTTERGDLTQFVVQLEYWIGGEWKEVVRYDHDCNTEGGHDVTKEGLHIDVYRDGEKVDMESVTGPLPAGIAMDAAEEHLEDHLIQYVRRFEQWHGIRSR